MFCFTGMSEHCLSEASLRAWVKQLQIISERSSGREFLCNFLVGTRKLEKFIKNQIEIPLRSQELKIMRSIWICFACPYVQNTNYCFTPASRSFAFAIRKSYISADLFYLKFLYAHKNSPYGLCPSRLILFATRTHFVPSVRNFKKKTS